MALYIDFSHRKSFSQLSKDSNFTFNLYRGRVDWKKIEMLDVDRIVRDQDVELLDMHISNVTNCNLASEYDVKILDPNFVKLFKLAQLLIDFLLHCKQYLEHNIKVAHESLQASHKEIQILQKQLYARKSEVKKLKKKMKEVREKFTQSLRASSPAYECSLCGKLFMNEQYLHGHHSRRHLLPMVLKPLNVPPPSHHIQLPVQEAKYKRQEPEEIADIKKKYQEEIEEMKNMFITEIEMLKQSEALKKSSHTNDETKNSSITHSEKKDNNQEVQNLNSTEKLLTQNEEFKKLSHTNDEKTNDSSTYIEKKDENQELHNRNSTEKEWLRRLEEREGIWRTRLSTLDQQHKQQIQQLQERLNSFNLKGQEMKKDVERQLEEVLSKFEQSQKYLETNNQDVKYVCKMQEEANQEESLLKSEKESSLKIESWETLDQKRVQQTPPIKKRNAFVIQKSKTIQDQESLETQTKEIVNNFVETLELADKSSLENISLQSQNAKKVFAQDYVSELDENKLSLSSQDKDKNSSVVFSRSKNRENIISKLLEEEKENHNDIKGNFQPMLVEESSISETTTETMSETESPEEQKHGQGQNRMNDMKQMSDDQAYRIETQLTQQSLQRMESLLAANPDIIQQLREDLEQLSRRRLQELGVDPGWRRLPPAAFNNKMKILTHQRQFTAKKHKFYFTLRDKLSEDADAAVHNHPVLSIADSLLARLRKKATQVVMDTINYTSHLGDALRKQDSLFNSNIPSPSKLQASYSRKDNLFKSTESSKPQHLTSYSPQVRSSKSSVISAGNPHLAPFSSVNLKNLVTPKTQSMTPKDSLSLASSANEDDEHLETAVSITYSIPEVGSYKSALRNALSTGNLTKKKVLFVDDAVKCDKRSLSNNAVTNTRDTQLDNMSVTSLVQEIQQQLNARGGRPALSIDLMKQPELPLSKILPLTKSGRELLESEPMLSTKNHLTNLQLQKKINSVDKTPLKTLEPISHSLQEIPQKKQNPLTLPGKRPEFPVISKNLKNILESPKLSPTHSLTSLDSSLFDISGSPTGAQGSLKWDLQDLEENLKD